MKTTIIAAFALIALVVLGMSLPTASAQPAGGTVPQVRLQPTKDGRMVPMAAQNQPSEASESVTRREHIHSDRVESTIDPKTQKNQSKGMALLFWMFAAGCIGGALFVVSRRNLIAAVMGMVGTFLAISAVYMMLYAHFLSVVQMLVYAGAIMVLFVFVVMILNRPEDEPVAPTGRAGQAIGALAILYLMGRVVMMLWQVKPQNPVASMLEPGPIVVNGVKHEWGGVKAVGTELFGPGLFPFEAISILLLVAVVGAIAIAGPLTTSDHEKTVGRDPEPKAH